MEEDQQQDLPKDALAVKQVLDSMAFAEYVGRPPGEVQLEDVVRAMQSQDTVAFAAPPPLDTLLELAEQRNKERLPAPKPNVYGLRLPPEAASLVGPNYQLRPPEPPT